MRSLVICLFLILFVSCLSQAQTTTVRPAFAPVSVTPRIAFAAFDSTTNSTAATVSNYSPVKTIPASSWYVSNLGFFCKKELQLEKAVKLPVKFRLGSVNYTDKMEGKRIASTLSP